MPERALLDWLQRTSGDDIAVPLGDDAAGLSLPGAGPLIVALDTLAEGSHFESDTALARIGRKALAVNLSDLAAMGAEPIGCLLGLTLRTGTGDDEARAIVDGLRDLGARFRCPLIGGDTVFHDGGLVLSVTALGTPMGAQAITRRGARVGDRLWLTGAIGGSFASGRHLDFEPRLAVARGLVEEGAPRAMIDVSDGLLLDLHRMADASNVGFEIFLGDVPVHEGVDRRAALGDGEDFELLLAADPGWEPGVATRRCGVALTPIGRCVAPAEGRWLVTEDGREAASARGWEHA